MSSLVELFAVHLAGDHPSYSIEHPVVEFVGQESVEGYARRKVVKAATVMHQGPRYLWWLLAAALRPHHCTGIMLE